MGRRGKELRRALPEKSFKRNVGLEKNDKRKKGIKGGV